ncbi:MAG: iron-containing alcohol dehydrogenase [Magnetococcales bacterium]|nr:iron-containing alcohol dehydrogenase [Magnetococcales bacterium]
MQTFTYHNPVQIVFGRETIARLRQLIPLSSRLLLTYGQGSIMRNGVYQQVKAALDKHTVYEFAGLEANPRYETCCKAVELCQRERIDFLLAVGGGSVLDGSKWIAAAALHQGDPWQLVTREAMVQQALPLGCVLTLPATGSEMNGFAVISRQATQEKYGFGSPHLYPRFAILDPTTTFSLDQRQIANGIVDTFVHVTEQYITTPCAAPLQDRQAEAILATLVEEAAKVQRQPDSYEVRANLMWCATQGLNGLIGCGVVQDWATHLIGHELTALYGLDHGQSLAVLLPGVWQYTRNAKQAKLAQFARRVWGQQGNEEELAQSAISTTESFFRSLGVKTRLSEYGIGEEAAQAVGERIEARGMPLGELANLGGKEVAAIVRLRL